MHADQTFTLDTAAGRITLDVYHDGNIWLTHPGTGVRVGLGRLEDDTTTPFVHVNTEEATDDCTGPATNGEPILHIALNDADVYEVTTTGPTPDSMFHKGWRAAQSSAARAARRATRNGFATAELCEVVAQLAEKVARLS